MDNTSNITALMKSLALSEGWRVFVSELDKRYLNSLQDDIETKDYKDMSEFNADRKMLKFIKEVKSLPDTIVSCYTKKESVERSEELDPYQK